MVTIRNLRRKRRLRLDVRKRCYYPMITGVWNNLSKEETPAVSTKVLRESTDVC